MLILFRYTYSLRNKRKPEPEQVNILLEQHFMHWIYNLSNTVAKILKKEIA